MEELTEEEIEFLKRAIVLIENKQLSNLLQGLVVREVDIISRIGNDEELRESSLWNIAALCSAIMQLRPGGWAFEDLEFEPIQVDTSTIQDQIETPETQISEDLPERSQNQEE